MTQYSLDGRIHIVQPEDTVFVRGPLLLTRKVDGSVFCDLGDGDNLFIELSSLKPGDASTYHNLEDGTVTTFIMSLNEGRRVRIGLAAPADRRVRLPPGPPTRERQ